MKITAFDDLYGLNVTLGGTTLISGSSGGSNAGFGPDVSGSWGDLSVVGLRQRVSLASNMGDNTVGTVLTTISSSPWVATFATPSNAGASYGSNSTRVSAAAAAGAASAVSRSDHIHDGIGTVTASSSNTLDRGTLNLRPGSNVTFGLTDSDGSGGFDTLTINATATGGGSGLTITEVDGSPTNTATKLILPNGTLSYSGTEATYTPASGGGGAIVRQTAASGQSVNVSSHVLTLSTAPTYGQVLLYGCESTSITISSVTQTNATWSLLHRYVGSAATIEVWGAAAAASVGTSITVTMSGTSWSHAAVVEASGITPSYVNATDVSGSTPQTITPAATGALLAIVARHPGGSGSFSIRAEPVPYVTDSYHNLVAGANGGSWYSAAGSASSVYVIDGVSGGSTPAYSIVTVN